MVSHEDYRPVIRQVFLAVNGNGTSEKIHHMVSPGGCRLQDPFSFFLVISGGSCGFDVFFVRLQMSQTAEHFYSAWNVCNNIHVFISLRQCRFLRFMICTLTSQSRPLYHDTAAAYSCNAALL